MKRGNLEGLFRSQKGFNDTFAMTSLNRFFDSNNDFLKDFTRKSFGRVPQKSKKYDFFQIENTFTSNDSCWGRVGLSVHVGGKSIFQNSCSYVLIMYSKGISNILNRFPALFSPYLHSWALYRLTKIFCKP